MKAMILAAVLVGTLPSNVFAQPTDYQFRPLAHYQHPKEPVAFWFVVPDTTASPQKTVLVGGWLWRGKEGKSRQWLEVMGGVFGSAHDFHPSLDVRSFWHAPRSGQLYLQLFQVFKNGRT